MNFKSRRPIILDSIDKNQLISYNNENNDNMGDLAPNATSSMDTNSKKITRWHFWLVLFKLKNAYYYRIKKRNNILFTTKHLKLTNIIFFIRYFYFYYRWDEPKSYLNVPSYNLPNKHVSSKIGSLEKINHKPGNCSR